MSSNVSKWSILDIIIYYQPTCSRPYICLEPQSSHLLSFPIASRLSETMVARVQAPAPEFKATAVVEGAFKDISLADYLGKWYGFVHSNKIDCIFCLFLFLTGLLCFSTHCRL